MNDPKNRLEATIETLKQLKAEGTILIRQSKLYDEMINRFPEIMYKHKNGQRLELMWKEDFPTLIKKLEKYQLIEVFRIYVGITLKTDKIRCMKMFDKGYLTEEE